MDGRVVCYDHVDKLTWSPIMIEHLVEDIGWEMAGRVKVYYYIPILAVNKNGFREIRSDADTDQMLNFLSIGHHYFSMYIDHDNSFSANRNRDDVVYSFPRAELPPVISPKKAVQSTGSGSVADEQVVQEENDQQFKVQGTVEGTAVEGTENDQQAEMGAGTSGTTTADSDDSEDSDFDPDALVDSDFNISEDDDNLFADNVDDDDEPAAKKDKGKEKVEEDRKLKGEALEKQTMTIAEAKEQDYESEGEDLWWPDSDDEERNKFRVFRGEDLHNPKFHVAKVFVSVEQLREAIKEYTCKNRRNIKMPVNDKKRLKAVCEGSASCSWYLWASKDSRIGCFMVKKYVDVHSCGKKYNVNGFTAPFLATSTWRVSGHTKTWTDRKSVV